MADFFSYHKGLFEVDKYLDASAVEDVERAGEGGALLDAAARRDGVPSLNTAGEATPFGRAETEVYFFGDIGVLPSARGDLSERAVGRTALDQLSPQQQRARNQRAATGGPPPWMRDDDGCAGAGGRPGGALRSPGKRHVRGRGKLLSAGASALRLDSPAGGIAATAAAGARAPRAQAHAALALPARAGGAAAAAAAVAATTPPWASASGDPPTTQRQARRRAAARAPWAVSGRPADAAVSAADARRPSPRAVRLSNPAEESTPVPQPSRRGYAPLYGPRNPRSEQALGEAVDVSNPLRPPVARSREDVRRKASKLLGTLWTGESIMELDAAVQRRVHSFLILEQRRERLRALLRRDGVAVAPEGQR